MKILNGIVAVCIILYIKFAILSNYPEVTRDIRYSIILYFGYFLLPIVWFQLHEFIKRYMIVCGLSFLCFFIFDMLSYFYANILLDEHLKHDVGILAFVIIMLPWAITFTLLGGVALSKFKNVLSR